MTYPIQSWLANTDFVIALVEDISECDSLVRRFSAINCVKHHCLHPTLRIPIVPCLLGTAMNISTTKYVLYLNGDIILSPIAGAMNLIKYNSIHDQPILLVGVRTNLKNESLKLSAFESPDIFTYFRQHGDLNKDWGIDYFIFNKNSIPIHKMPPFVIGNVLFDNWLVSATIEYTTTKVVEVSQLITALHPATTKANLTSRPGYLENYRAFYSDSLSCSSYSIGKTSHADYSIDNNMLVEVKNRSDVTRTRRFLRSVQHLPSGYVLVLVVLRETEIVLIENWLMWLNRTSSSASSPINFVALACDDVPGLDRLLSRPVVYRSCHNTTKEQDFAEDIYLGEIMDYLRLVSMMGYGVLTVRPATLLLGDPFPSILQATAEASKPSTYTYTARSFDSFGIGGIGHLKKQNFLGFFGVAPCYFTHIPPALKPPQKVDVYARIERFGCIRQNHLCFTKKLYNMHYLSLPSKIIASMFVLKNHLPHTYPLVVHFGKDEDPSLTIEHMKAFDLWGASLISDLPLEVQRKRAEGATKLLRTIDPIPSGGRDSSTCKFTLTIRILALDRPLSLSRLLNSLYAAHYDGDLVDLSVHVDRPSAADNLSNYLGVLEIVKAIKWAHGKLHLVIQPENVGIFKSWVVPVLMKPGPTSSGPCVSAQQVIVLEDDVQVSPSFYMWGKYMWGKYRYDLSSTSMYGFSLQRMYSVVGIKNGKSGSCWKPRNNCSLNFSTDYIDKELDPRFSMYRYQLLSTWGTFMDISIWNHFVEWALARKEDPLFQPCVPYNENVNWYLRAPSKMWSHFFFRYVFDRGLYSLYLNYNNLCEKGQNCALVVNFRENGLHFNSSDSKVTSIKETLYHKLPRDSDYSPRVSQYPLYDFMMEPVPFEPALELRKNFLFGMKDHCISKFKPIVDDKTTLRHTNKTTLRNTNVTKYLS